MDVVTPNQLFHLVKDPVRFAAALKPQDGVVIEDLIRQVQVAISELKEEEVALRGEKLRLSSRVVSHRTRLKQLENLDAQETADELASVAEAEERELREELRALRSELRTVVEGGDRDSDIESSSSPESPQPRNPRRSKKGRCQTRERRITDPAVEAQRSQLGAEAEAVHQELLSTLEYVKAAERKREALKEEWGVLKEDVQTRERLHEQHVAAMMEVGPHEFLRLCELARLAEKHEVVATERLENKRSEWGRRLKALKEKRAAYETELSQLESREEELSKKHSVVNMSLGWAKQSLEEAQSTLCELRADERQYFSRYEDLTLQALSLDPTIPLEVDEDEVVG
eukprot:Rmarinus@m.8756